MLPRARRTTAKKTARPERKRLDLEVRREQLLGAAFDLFLARGYDQVGIEDVARAAGASKGLVYHYFPTKKDLYRAAVERGAAQLLARTETPATTPPLERLEAGLAVYFGYVAEHRMAYEALMRSGVGVDPDVADVLERTRGVIAERILEGLPLVPAVAARPAVKAAVRGWIGFVEALALGWLARPEPDSPALRRLAADVLQAAVAGAVGLDEPPG